MLLIDDDQAQRVHRSEYGGAGADDDARAALSDLVPFVMPFAGGQVAVQDRHQSLAGAAGEARLETLHRLRRQRNLRHQHNGPSPLKQGVGDGLQIDLRLAAAGHAVEEENGPLSFRRSGRGRGGLGDRGDGALLGVVQLERLGREDDVARVRIALGDLRRDVEEPFVFQAAEGLAGGAGLPQQFLQRHLLPRPRYFQDCGLALAQGRGWIGAGKNAHEKLFAPPFLFLAHRLGQNRLEGDLRRRAIILAHPAGQFQNPGRDV